MKPRKHNYANGSQVKCYADGGSVTKDKKTPTRQGDTVKAEAVGSTADTLRNANARRMKALGLADGGRVVNPPKHVSKTKVPPYVPPKVKSPITRRGGRKGS